MPGTSAGVGYRWYVLCLYPAAVILAGGEAPGNFAEDGSRWKASASRHVQQQRPAFRRSLSRELTELRINGTQSKWSSNGRYAPNVDPSICVRPFVFRTPPISRLYVTPYPRPSEGRVNNGETQKTSVSILREFHRKNRLAKITQNNAGRVSENAELDVRKS